MLGYFSGEWTLFSVLGLAGAFALRYKAVVVPSPTYGWSTVTLITLGFYLFLRLAGRTPEGITYGSHPAARGHPVLSMVVTAAIFVILASRLLWS